ncbi:MAG: 3-oxoacyl-ACP synthase [Saprospiraceae bacterium]
MIEQQQLKEALLAACAQNISERLNNINARFRSIEEARNNESKSSVGDKHETGRAMMQLEEENLSVQLKETSLLKDRLARVDLSRQVTIGLGSLVYTDRGKYFFAIGLGKILLEEEKYFCISLEAPIGGLMRGKKEGEAIVFNGRTIQILAIH